MLEFHQTKQIDDLRESTYNVISKMSKCAELKKVKNKVKKEEETYNMCQAITEMIEDGREEGRLEGLSQGISQGINSMSKLIAILTDENRIDDLIRVANDNQFQMQLLREYELV